MDEAFHLENCTTLYDVTERVIVKVLPMDKECRQLEQDIRDGYSRYGNAPGNKLKEEDARHVYPDPDRPGRTLFQGFG